VTEEDGKNTKTGRCLSLARRKRSGVTLRSSNARIKPNEAKEKKNRSQITGRGKKKGKAEDDWGNGD